MARILDDLTDMNSHETYSLEKMNARLKRSGVPSRILRIQSKDTEHFRAKYRIKVNGFDSADVMQTMRGGSILGWSDGGILPGGLEDGLRKRVEKAAIRALYTLGSDRGEVEIVALPGRRYAVNEIVLAKKNTQQMNQFDELESIERGSGVEAPHILMGMDPEFILVSKDGRIVPASLYLERNGTAGSDAVRQGDEVSYPLGELRPAPQSHPDKLLQVMRHALDEARRLITDHSLNWRAGGLPAPGLPLGGHIHFSGVSLNLSILQCLDNYLALPLAIIEDPNGRKRRPRYGFLGDFRKQPYGGFEYRTLPSFLVSPFITKASLYMAYLIVLHHDKLRARPLSRERYHKAYYEGNPEVLREVASKLYQDYTLLPNYEAYSSTINRLFDYIRDGRTWDESRDIRPLWNIPAVP